jgi:hypothetical protein
MTPKTLIALAAATFVVVADTSFAEQRGRRGPDRGGAVGRAVPRGSVRPNPPIRRGAPGYYRGDRDYRGYRGYRGYYGPGNRFLLGYGYPYYYGYPGYYGGYGYGWFGYSHPVWGYGHPAWGYGHPAWGAGPYYGGFVGVAPGRPYGGVRIDLPEREAEVFVDGYYAGSVDDFDGTFQELKLEPGPHRIEIKAEGYEPVAFDVDVQVGRTITYRTRLRPHLP